MRDHFKLSGWYSFTKNVERTTDAKEGNYAIKLINTTNGNRGLARNLDYNNKQEINGDAVSGDALSISFWCKYDLAAGDTARFYAVLREKGTYKGKVDFRFTGDSDDEFVKFTIPIEWNTSGNRQIDSAWFNLYSYVENVVDGDGYVIFDDFAFENIGERVGAFPNSGFEDWYNVGVEFPENWRSVDLLVYDTYTSFLNTPSSTKTFTKDAHTGNHSLVIQNYMSGDNVRRGYSFIGEENNDYYTPHFPFVDTFKYIQGYYKFIPDGSDTARINMRTYHEGNSRSNNNLFIHEEATEWTYFSMPLTYNSTLDPDSAALIFYSGNDQDGEYNLGTKLYLDNLELVLEPTPLQLSIVHIENTITNYPNPTSDKVYLDTREVYTTCTIADALGKTEEARLINNTVSLKNYPSGIYFITLHGANNSVSALKIQKY